jgi:hypothetical protein
MYAGAGPTPGGGLVISLTFLVTALSGCVQQPLFSAIDAVTVQHVSANGLHKTELQQTGLKLTGRCLQTAVEVNLEATQSRQLLQTTYLLIIKDDIGQRNFEMLTDHHIKGNKGKYYETACLLPLIEEYAPVTN